MLNAETTGWIELDLRMPYHAMGHGTVVLNGEIYVFGGLTSTGETDKLFKLDKKLKWKELASMNTKRSFIGSRSVVYDGAIWVIGGAQTKKVERYDPVQDLWEYKL